MMLSQVMSPDLFLMKGKMLAIKPISAIESPVDV